MRKIYIKTDWLVLIVIETDQSVYFKETEVRQLKAEMKEEQQQLTREAVTKDIESTIPTTDDVSVDLQIDTEKEHRLKDFMKILGGQGFSLVGSALVQFSLVWWLTITTGSAIVLAIATIMALLPQILISPFAGVLVDRWDRRKVMITSDGIAALMIVILAFLFAQGSANVFHVYGIMAIRSAVGVFQWPALQASVSLMVPDEHLSRINGLYQSLSGLAQIAAPPLGAMLLLILPIQMIILIDIVTAAMAILPLLFIRIPQPNKDSSDEEKSSIIADMMEGVRFLTRWRGGQFTLFAMMLINMILVPSMSLIPIFALVHFNSGAFELAWLQSALGVGMLVGGITLSVWGGFKRRMNTVVAAVIAMGIAILTVGLTPSGLLFVAVAGLFITGIMVPMASGSIMAILQAIVPKEMQGRVFSVIISLSPLMAPIGLALAGPIAEVFGASIWYLISGVMIMLIGLVGRFDSTIMRMEEVENLLPPAPLTR
jgi:DHA3 family macrolide efflux protein-like MFS transporter